ncbi:MAG: response regulator [Pirellulales bacterium]
MNRSNSSNRRKCVLFVDDERHLLCGLERLLFDYEESLDLRFAASGREALTILESERVDVIFSDMRMPQMDGSQLLQNVQRQYPSTIRLMLSGQAALNTIIRTLGHAHQFLAKPCSAAQLKGSLENCLELSDVLERSQAAAYAAGLTSLPIAPRTIAAVEVELDSPEPVVTRIAEAASQDIGMSGKLLQIGAASLYHGIDPAASTAEIITTLGLDRFRPLVRDVCPFLRESDGYPLDEVETEEILHACRWVGRLSGLITELILPGDYHAKHMAISAGGLHRTGDLLIRSWMHAVTARADDGGSCFGSSAAVAESELSEAELAGCLLKLWGLPVQVIEAVENYRVPCRAQISGFAPVTAVHLAHAIYDQLFGRSGAPAAIDSDYLELVGIGSRVQELLDACSHMIEAESAIV